MSDSPFALAAPSLIDMGYSPMPVAPRCDPQFENHRPPTGKEPGRLNSQGRWVRLNGWTVFCKRQLRPEIIASWSSWPDAGVCVATGFNCLVAIDIDRDDLVDPILEVLSPVLVAKRGRKGLTAFYRAAEQLPSTNYKDADKRGLLDFLSGGKQTVIPGTVHPDTGRPYEWTTERTLLNTPLGSLPVLTQAHRAAMEEVLRRFGWNTPEPRVSDSEAVVERPVRASSEPRRDDNDFDAIATARRGEWLPKLGLQNLRPVSGGWRSVASFRESGSGTPLHERDLNLSIRDDGPIVDHVTGKGYNNATLVAQCRGISTAEAYVWLRAELGLPDAPVPAPVALPTYEDTRMTVEEAQQAARATIRNFLDEVRRAGRVAIGEKAHDIAAVARIDVGVGKTFEAIEALPDQVMRADKLRIVYVVPRHDLGKEIEAHAKELGMKPARYCGYRAQDPEKPKGTTMCLNLKAADKARECELSVGKIVCPTCLLASKCGVNRQRNAALDNPPDFWIVPKQRITFKIPEQIVQPDVLLVDEKVHDVAVPDKASKLTLCAFSRMDTEGLGGVEPSLLETCRGLLRRIAIIINNGPITRATLVEHGFKAELAADLSLLEWRRIRAPDESQDADGWLEFEKKQGARNRQAKVAADLWGVIMDFLNGKESVAENIRIVKGERFEWRRMTPFHPTWRAPSLFLDATATDKTLLEAVSGRTINQDHVTDIAAKRPDCTRVVQVIDAPDSKTRLGLVKRPAPRNAADVVRAVNALAAGHFPAQVGFITYQKFLEEHGDKLSENVLTAHFGALSGLNIFNDVPAGIVHGTPRAMPEPLEENAAVFGAMVGGEPGTSFDKRDFGIMLKSGVVFATKRESHPNPTVDALRWQVTEAELVQALGRFRLVRRTEANPCAVFLITATPLPIEVDRVVTWDELKLGPWADQTQEGVLLRNHRPIVTAYKNAEGKALWGEDAAWERRVDVGGFLLRWRGPGSPISLLAETPQHRLHAKPRRVTYRRAKPKQLVNEAVALPHGPQDEATMREWLEARLGPMAHVEVERLKTRNSATALAMLAKAWGASPINTIMQTSAAIVAQLRGRPAGNP